MVRLRTTDEFERPRRSGRRTRECTARGCRTPTRGSKPYCSKHVGLNPYAQELLDRIQARAR